MSIKSDGIISADEYRAMDARQQGFWQYMQGALSGSELKNIKNHYPVGSTQFRQWNEGQQEAVLFVQDWDDS